jgi:hypothetical protein
MQRAQHATSSAIVPTFQGLKAQALQLARNLLQQHHVVAVVLGHLASSNL